MKVLSDLTQNLTASIHEHDDKASGFHKAENL